jgi:hypothetical protein
VTYEKTVLDEMWRKWTEKKFDVEVLPAYPEDLKRPPWMTSRERLIAAAEEDSPIDLLEIQHFLKEREQQGTLRHIHLQQAQNLILAKNVVRVMWHGHLFIVPRKKILNMKAGGSAIWSDFVKFEKETQSQKMPDLRGETALQMLSLMQMLAHSGIGVRGTIRNDGAKTTFYDFYFERDFSKLTNRAIFHGLSKKLVNLTENLMLSQIGDQLNSTDYKNKSPTLDPRFPSPWHENWQPPIGHPEPDPQTIVDPTVLSGDMLSLFGIYR